MNHDPAGILSGIAGQADSRSRDLQGRVERLEWLVNELKDIVVILLKDKQDREKPE